MSGGLSNVSGGSSESSTSLSTRRRVVGVPKRCWCGEQILGLISKSDQNPYRRYFRCAYAVAGKLRNDNHAFKWVDEGLEDEIETLKLINGRLEQDLKVLKSECMEFENKLFEKVQMKLKSDIMERVEGMLSEAQCSMKKTMLLVAIGCMIVVACIKLVG